jgi:hypothetical protein
MNESELKRYFLRNLAKDFTVHDEVTGRFLVDGTKVIVDYLLYPKSNLIEKGFVSEWFGVEIKSPITEGAKKGLQVAWQAITYSQSEFSDVRIGQNIRPAFVLIFPPLSEFFGNRQDAYYVMCLLQKANVGYIEIDEQKGKWKIGFGANIYFYSDRGLSKTPNVSVKRHVGSWK